MAAHSNAVAPPRRFERASDPVTLPQLVRRSASAYEGSAMRFWQEGRWRDLSYRELGRAAFEIAGGLISLGVRPGDRVSILAGTRPEWTLADLGALCAGAVVAPIYHTNSPEECRYILEHAGSRVVFCEGTDQLAKVTQVRAHCPLLEHVITLDGGAAISLHDVFGDDRPYLVATLTLDHDWIGSLAAWLGIEPDLAQMANNDRVHARLAREVDRVNERFARVEQVKRFVILDREITQETGELTPTQKAKRAVVYSRFKDVIDSLYE